MENSQQFPIWKKDHFSEVQNLIEDLLDSGVPFFYSPTQGNGEHEQAGHLVIAECLPSQAPDGSEVSRESVSHYVSADRVISTTRIAFAIPYAPPDSAVQTRET